LDRSRQAAEDIGGPTVGLNPEGVGALSFEQLGDFVEMLGNLAVVERADGWLG
jgi:hypothetical protein